MAEDLTKVQKELEFERDKVKELQEKLTQTTHMKNEFGRTVNAIEDTFDMISSERDNQVRELEVRLEQKGEELQTQKRTYQDREAVLRDEAEGLRVDLCTLQSRLDLLTATSAGKESMIKDLQNQVEDLHTETQELRTELDEYLPSGEDDDDPMESKQAKRERKLRREREVIQTACDQVSELGDAVKYNNIEHVLEDITALYASLTLRFEEAKKKLKNKKTELAGQQGLLDQAAAVRATLEQEIVQLKKNLEEAEMIT